MTPKLRRLLIAVFSLGVIFDIIVGLVFTMVPSASKVLPANSNPIVAVLTHPENNTSWPADTSIPIAVTAYGDDPITTVELWIDGSLYNSTAPFGNEISAYKSWYWMPGTEGKHTFFVRAVDSQGRTAETNAVHITATAAAGFLHVVPAKGDETLAGMAESSGNSIEELTTLNSGINPEELIPAGTEVIIPISFPVSSPELVAEEPPPSEPADEGKTNYQTGLPLVVDYLFKLVTKLPVTPNLHVSQKECDAVLKIIDKSDNEDGFFVYQLSEQDVSFNRVATVEPHEGTGIVTYTIPKIFGQNQFYVSAYNVLGEASSPPKSVEILSAACSTTQAVAENVSYADGIVTMPKNTALAYFYLSLGENDWQRVPAGHDYFSPKVGKIDLRKEIKKVIGSDAQGLVKLDTWGWQGQDLKYLGRLNINISYTTLKICGLGTSLACTGDVASSNWVNTALVGSDKADTTRGLRWSAYGPDITGGLWQVSTEPFPEKYTPNVFSGLILTGISIPEIESDGVAKGNFDINFSTDLNVPQSEVVENSNISFFQTYQANSFDTDLLKLFNDPDPMNPNVLNALLTKTLYIRVVPMAGGHPAGDPSNTVVVTYKPTGEPDITIYGVPTFKVEIVPDSFNPEILTENKLGIRGCSWITAVDYDKYMAANFPGASGSVLEVANQYYAVWKSNIGQKVCPAIIELEDPSALQEIWSAISGAWNSLVDAFESLKASLVNALAGLLPGCDATCKLLLTTGLNFAISYFTGIPPTIPNFDDMVDKGIDYVVQQAIAQTGVPYCDTTCQDLIAGQIKNAADSLKTQKPSISCAAQKYTMSVWENGVAYHLQPLCIPVGVSSIPVFHSINQNATIQVKVTRIDTFNQPIPTELLVIDSYGINTAYATGQSKQDLPHTKDIWTHGDKFYTVTFSEPLQGGVFPQTSEDVPGIDSMQSVTIPVILRKSPGDFEFTGYPPRIAALQAAFPGQDVTNWAEIWYQDYSHLNDMGAKITFSAYVLCQDQKDPTIYTSPCSNKISQEFIVPQQVAPVISVPLGP